MSKTNYRVIKRHADDYVAVDSAGLTCTDWPGAGVSPDDLADGESLTIVREFTDGTPADRQRAWNRAVGTTSDEEAMNAIARILDGDWNSDTPAAIWDVVRETGRTIRDSDD